MASPMEIVFSFDTTGSMGSCLPDVKAGIQAIMVRLFADIPALKVAIFAHGDYCDCKNYVTKYVDFTNDVGQLCKFVSTITTTHGGDADECYELVLHQVRTKLKWSHGSQRALVLIGDSNPHGVDYKDNTLKLDWKKETQLLANEGVRIYGVNCGRDAESFFKYVSDNTGGRKINLDDLSSITSMLMAVCYREKGAEALQAFEREFHSNRDEIAKSLSGVFEALHDDDHDDDEVCEAELSTTTPETSFGKKKGTLQAENAVKTPNKRKLNSVEANRLSTERMSAVKRRKGSVESHTSDDSYGSRKSTTPKSTHTMARRSTKHKMKLRKRPTVLLHGRITKKKVSKSPGISRPVKINRESMLGKQFLEDLKWTPWTLALAPSCPAKQQHWSPRPGGRKGNRNELIVVDTRSPAVYEFAVAPPGSSTKYPLYSSVTKGFSNQSWETKFLSQPHLQQQLDGVLSRNCQIYARSAPIANDCESSEDVGKAVAELRHLLASQYDYAWQEHYNVNTRMYHHRRLYKNGILISE